MPFQSFTSQKTWKKNSTQLYEQRTTQNHSRSMDAIFTSTSQWDKSKNGGVNEISTSRLLRKKSNTMSCLNIRTTSSSSNNIAHQKQNNMSWEILAIYHQNSHFIFTFYVRIRILRQTSRCFNSLWRKRIQDDAGRLYHIFNVLSR